MTNIRTQPTFQPLPEKTPPRLYDHRVEQLGNLTKSQRYNLICSGRIRFGASFETFLADFLRVTITPGAGR